jgi:hypothetical protein
VTLAIQALPAAYNSSVTGLIETKCRAGQVVTVEKLKKVVINYYGVPMKGKMGTKAMDIERGLAATEAQN